jgi:hypothetical protein
LLYKNWRYLNIEKYQKALIKILYFIYDNKFTSTAKQLQLNWYNHAWSFFISIWSCHKCKVSAMINFVLDIKRKGNGCSFLMHYPRSNFAFTNHPFISIIYEGGEQGTPLLNVPHYVNFIVSLCSVTGCLVHSLYCAWLVTQLTK